VYSVNGLAMKMPALLMSVDAPEPGYAFGDRTLGCLPIGNVAGHRDDPIIIRRADRARGRDHPVVAIAVRLGEGCSNALGGAADYCNFLFDSHDGRPLHC
jgi:hypothetical protein